MKKRVLSVLLVFVLLLCLTACGEKEETKKGSKRDKNETTVTATPTPTGEVTPTSEPTPEPTAEPTPVPTDGPKQGQLPVPDVMEGPPVIIARGDGNDRYSDHYPGKGPAFDSQIDYLYLVEGGLDNLGAALRALNLEAYQKNAKTRESAAELLDELTYEMYTQWYETSYIDILRNDSKVFSFTRTNDSYLGGAQNYMYRSGYTLDAETGERLDLWSVINDARVFGEDIVKLFAQYENEYGYFDNWKERLSECVSEGGLGWAYTDDGLVVWCNNGVLAPYVVGEVSIEYPIKDYPDRFIEKYIGAYGDYDPKPRYIEGLISYEDGFEYHRSEMYCYLIYGLEDGVGEWTFEDLQEFLRDNDIEMTEGFGDKEAAERESNAYAIFYDLEFGDRFFVYFWPEDEKDVNSTQRIQSISVTFPDTESFLIYDLDDDGYLQFEIIDCSFDGSRDSAVVYSCGTAFDVLIVTFPNYYSDIKKK